MNKQIEELVERVRLNPFEIKNIVNSHPHVDEVKSAELATKAQLHKVLSDPDLALIRRDVELPEINETCLLMQGRLLAYNIELRKAGFTHPIITLTEEEGK